MARLLTELAAANKLLGEKEAAFKREFEDAAAQHELEIEQLKTQLIEADQAESDQVNIARSHYRRLLRLQERQESHNRVCPMVPPSPRKRTSSKCASEDVSGSSGGKTKPVFINVNLTPLKKVIVFEFILNLYY